MFLFYFSRWVVQFYASKKISFSLFLGFLVELVEIPFQLVCCFSIYLFFFFSFLYNHEYDGHTSRR